MTFPPNAASSPRGGALSAGRRLLRLLLLLPMVHAATAPVRAQSPVLNWFTFAGIPGVRGSTDTATGLATFSNPIGVCVDTEGTVYAVDASNATIRKITPAGVVSTYAGLPGTAGTADGTGSAARFDRPAGMAMDAEGTLYVADNGNHTIRKVAPGGVVTTLAGLADVPGSNTGSVTGDAARFNSPVGIAYDPRGFLYVADTNNHTIRRIVIATRVVTTIAGKTGVASAINGPGLQATFNLPASIAYDGVYSLYITDHGNNVIRKFHTINDTVTTEAGVVTSGAGTEVDGTSTTARFSGPWGIVWTGDRLFVTDLTGNTIRQVKNGFVSTVGGQANVAGLADGNGSAATFFRPASITLSPDGTLYLSDHENHRICAGRFKPGLFDYRWGVVAGAGDSQAYLDGPAFRARLRFPAALAMDSKGDMIFPERISHTVRRFSRSGQVITIAGSPGEAGSRDGVASFARFDNPFGVAVDPVTGVIFVSDYNNYTIRQINDISSGGVVSTLAGAAGQSGSSDGPQASARFRAPGHMTMLPDGSLAVADLSEVVRRVTRQGTVSTIAGAFNTDDYVDATGTAARFKFISGLAADKQGNIYVSDATGGTIRKILPSGAVVTLAGKKLDRGFIDGPAGVARFWNPGYLAVDGDGVLYVTDDAPTGSGEDAHGVIRRVTPNGGVTTICGTLPNFGDPPSLLRIHSTGPLLAGPDGLVYAAESFRGVILRGCPAGNFLQRYSDGAAGLTSATDSFSRCEVLRGTTLNGPWSVIGSPFAGSDGTVSVTDAAAPAGRAFYKLRVLSTH